MNEIRAMLKCMGLVAFLSTLLAAGSSARAQTSLHYPAVWYRIAVSWGSYFDATPEKVCAKYANIDPDPRHSYGVVPDPRGISLAGRCQAYHDGSAFGPGVVIDGVCQWNPDLQAVTGIRGGTGSAPPIQDAGYVTCSCPAGRMFDKATQFCWLVELVCIGSGCANLGGSAVLYGRFLRRRAPLTQPERWQTGFLPVYAVWAWIVVIAFPPIFGFR